MAFDINALTGLTKEEAARRLEVEGHNELSAGGGRHVLRMFLDIFREPMFLLLIGGGSSTCCWVSARKRPSC